MKNKNLCERCFYFKALRWNLFKKDETHPLVYFIHCGLAPNKEDGFTKCKFYKKKKLKHRLGMAL